MLMISILIPRFQLNMLKPAISCTGWQSDSLIPIGHVSSSYQVITTLTGTVLGER